MAYSFQTFSYLQVLTSVQANQLEENILKHEHGVTANCQVLSLYATLSENETITGQWTFSRAESNWLYIITTAGGNFNAGIRVSNVDREYAAGILGDSLDSFIIQDNTAAMPRLTITTGGDVGIGVSTPQAKLHVQQSGACWPLIETVSAGDNAGVQLKTPAGTWRCGNVGASNTLGIDNSWDAYGTPKITITTGGDVGIGMSPSYKLDVSGSCRISNYLAVGTTPTTYPFQVLGSNAGNYAVHIYNSSATGYGMKIRNGDDTKDAIRISNAVDGADTIKLYGSGIAYFAGIVGLGVTPATYPLTIKSIGGDVVSWQYNDGTEKGRLGIITDSGVHGWIGLYNSSGVENLRLAGNGKITLTTASGVAPIILPTAYASGANVTNLSADMVDGLHSTDFLRSNMSVVRGIRTTTQSLSDIVPATVVFDSVATGSSSEYNSSTGIFTAATAGWYLVQASVEFQSNATGYRQIKIDKSGTDVAYDHRNSPSASATEHLHISTLLSLAINDTIKVVGYQNSGGSLNIMSGYQTQFTISRIK